MIKPLNFKWPGKIWILSDLHFGHSYILNLERTMFKSIEEHDNVIFNNLKKTISSEDTFLCLGDLGKNWEKYIKKLKCYKVLILGNHDNDTEEKYKKFWNEVYDGPLFLNKYCVCSHEPVQISDHFLNIHGHLHGTKLDEEKYINVSAAVLEHKFFPVNFQNFMKKTEKLPKIRGERFLQEWFKDKYIFLDKLHIGDVPVYSDGHIVKNAKEILSFFFDYRKKEQILVEPFMINWDSLKKDFSFEKLKKEIEKWKMK